MVFLVLGYWRQRSFISTVRLWRWWQNGGLFVTTYTWIQLFSWSYSGRGKKKKWIIKYNWHTTSESDPCGEAVPFSGSSLAEPGTIAQSAYGEQPCSLALLGLCETRHIWGLHSIAVLPWWIDGQLRWKLLSCFLNYTRNTMKHLWSSVARHLFQSYFLNMFINIFLSGRGTTRKHLTVKVSP